MWNGIGWYGFIGPTTSTTDISLGPGQSDKKSSDDVFYFVLSLFYRSQMANFKEILSCFKVPEGVQHFPGGSNFFQGGSNCLFPIVTHVTCDFPGGGVRTPCPPLWIRTCEYDQELPPCITLQTNARYSVEEPQNNNIGIAPIAQLRMCVIKNSDIQERSPS